MGILLLLVLLLLIFGSWPRGPEPGYYSYGVPGGFGLILLVLLIVLLLGHGPVVWW